MASKAEPSSSVSPGPTLWVDQQRQAAAKGKGRITGSQQGNHHQKRPTHFVCLPLVTESSIPQLAKSLETFRRLTTPLREEESEDDFHSQDQHPESYVNARPELRIIPSAAHRAPGTFHLTLGTMDLSDPGRMNAALEVLGDIDYASLLNEAGRMADNVEMQKQDPSSSEALPTETRAVKNGKNAPIESLEGSISPPPALSSSGSSNSKAKHQPPPLLPARNPPPLTITMHSLGTFPSTTSARVFFARPHDPTSRLQSFAETVQQEFKASGLLNAEPAGRGLTLHATVANLIYMRDGSSRVTAKGARGKHGHRRAGNGERVDATEVVEFFSRAQTQRTVEQDGRSPTPAAPENEQSKCEANEELGFIWARNITVDRIRICKMGATKSEDAVLSAEYPPCKEGAEVCF